MIWTYIIIAVLLFGAELLYFRIADHFNIIDKPNERSSHSKVVLRGGGIIFTIAMIVWAVLMAVQGRDISEYLPFLGGLLLIAGVSFVDDVHSLPDSVRLVAQCASMALMAWSLGVLHWEYWWIALIGAVVFVGASNIVNFMDGINGITACYSLGVLVPLALLNGRPSPAAEGAQGVGFIEQSFLMVAVLGVLVFAWFNCRPRGKVKCFAGDVGAVGIAFIMLFALGRLMMKTGDVTWLVFLVVYGVDGCCTIVHRIMLHENLGAAHRKHLYQLLANELHRGHVFVSFTYMTLQLVISMVMIYVIPNTPQAHWIYLIAVTALLCGGYVWFMKANYHLHEEYLASLKKD